MKNVKRSVLVAFVALAGYGTFTLGTQARDYWRAQSRTEAAVNAAQGEQELADALRRERLAAWHEEHDPPRKFDTGDRAQDTILEAKDYLRYERAQKKRRARPND